MKSTAKQMETCSRKRLPFLTDTQICKDDDTRKDSTRQASPTSQTVGIAYRLVTVYNFNKQKIKKATF